MKVYARGLEIVDIIRQKQKASVEELAAHLDVSCETIRRDLTRLAAAGEIQKTHGGATLAMVMGEGSFKQRMHKNAAAKLAIAKTAAGLFKPGETLFIDTGSTTLFFAEEIAKIEGLTIITNATEIARAVSKVQNTSKVFLLGGEFGATNSQTIGTMVSAQIRLFRAQHVVLTIGALDAAYGAMDFNIEESQVAREMIEQSEKVTVLADELKMNAAAPFQVCPLSRISYLVTNKPPAEKIYKDITRSGGSVLLSN